MGEWVNVRTCFGIVYSNYQVKQVPHESGSSWPEEQVLTSSDFISQKDVTKITTYWPHLIILLNTRVIHLTESRLKSVNMTEKLTTTNVNMVNLTENIINITTTTNING